jgi:8-oxo-dGTP pyrophosphatase MutT (NUDIX family)
MPTELSAGVIVFRNVDAHREYLLLRSAHGHWEFPKGHLEADETWQQAAMRELAEESGITDALAIPGFARQIEYFFKEKKKGLVEKTVAFLVAATKQSTTTISDEHTESAFLPFDDALRQLSHSGTRGLLRDAEAFLRASDV